MNYFSEPISLYVLGWLGDEVKRQRCWTISLYTPLESKEFPLEDPFLWDDHVRRCRSIAESRNGGRGHDNHDIRAGQGVVRNRTGFASQAIPPPKGIKTDFN